MEVLVQGTEGPVTGTVITDAQVSGRPFVIVDLGVGAYIKGVYTRYAVVPAHLLINRNIQDRAEVVNGD